MRDAMSFGVTQNMNYEEYGDGILGHQFNRRLEFFAPCYSQTLLQADFKENHTLLWF
jgi:hypothetical protein